MSIVSRYNPLPLPSLLPRHRHGPAAGSGLYRQWAPPPPASATGSAEGYTSRGLYQQRVIPAEGYTSRGLYQQRVIPAAGYTGRGLYQQRAPPLPASAASSMSRAPVGDNHGQQFLLHVEVHSVLQIDVEVEGPEMSENPTQSFEIH